MTFPLLKQKLIAYSKNAIFLLLTPVWVLVYLATWLLVFLKNVLPPFASRFGCFKK